MRPDDNILKYFRTFLAAVNLDVFLLLALLLYALNYQFAKPVVHIIILFCMFVFVRKVLRSDMDLFKSRSRNLINISFLSSVAILYAHSLIYQNPTSQYFFENYGMTVLSCIFISFFMAKKVGFMPLLRVAVISTLLLSLKGIVEYYQHGMDWYRVDAGFNLPIIYGTNVAILSVLSMNAMGLFFRDKQYVWFVMSLLAISAGITAIAMSGSRGPLLTVLFLIAVVLAVQGYRTIHGRALLGVLVAMITASIISFSLTSLDDRLIDGFQNLSSGHTTTSIGVRVELWKGALDIIKHRPFLGVGAGEHNTYFAERLKQDSNFIHDSAYGFKHLHNDILNVLAWMGLFFGSIFLLPIACLLVYFWRQRHSDVGFSGLTIVVTFMLCGLTNTPLMRSTSVSLLVLLTMYLLSLIENTKKEVGTE